MQLHVPVCHKRFVRGELCLDSITLRNTLNIQEKRISKIETLRLALSYIELLMDTLNQSELPTDYLRRCANGEIKESKRWKTTGKSVYAWGSFNFI